MSDYKKMYHILFNEITKAIDRLQEAQILTESLYINSGKTGEPPADNGKEEDSN